MTLNNYCSDELNSSIAADYIIKNHQNIITHPMA